MVKRILFLWLLSYSQTMFISCQSFPTVTTPSGPIKGVVVSALGKQVEQYRNIPFAKPPVGDLRFRKPEEVEPWTDTLDGTTFGPSCMQDMNGMMLFNKLMENQEISEDCLQLNVFVPGSASPGAKKAVMVWFYGGVFVYGSSTVYDASFLALKDVIVVTANYRIGAFGFLSTGDSVLPGNYGLWDQIEALKWVHNNIAAFGGDPERVTIFGESAGGFSVSFLALIPSNEGLFHRVICQSGAANGFVSISRNPLKAVEKIAEKVGCIVAKGSRLDTSTTIECLREKSADDILNSQGNPMELFMNKEFSLVFDFWPVIDRVLIQRHPAESLKDPNLPESRFFRSLDLVAGTTNNEGPFVHVMFSAYQESYKFNTLDGIPSSALCEVYAPVVAKQMFNDDTIVSDMICKEYSVDSLAEQGRIISKLHADVYFVSPTVELLGFHAGGGNTNNTYHYLYTQTVNSDNPFPTPEWMEGASHATELIYEFGPKYLNTLSEELRSVEGRKFTDIFVTYWTNFAKTGNPNGEGLVDWKPYNVAEKDYLELKFEPAPRKNLYEKRMRFLQEVIPNRLRELRETVKTEL